MPPFVVDASMTLSWCFAPLHSPSAGSGSLARDHRPTAYDAAYLDLARREQLSLATLDHDLQAAGVALGVATLDL